MKSRRTSSNFLKSFLYLFLLYLLIIPAVFAMLDWQLMSRYYQKDGQMLVLAIAGSALAISLSLSLWLRHDKRLHRW